MWNRWASRSYLSDPFARALAFVVAFLGLGLVCRHLYLDAPAELDDAFITFRYSRSLVEGLGLVFNAEDGPLEGFTNLSWVLLNAAAMKVGLDPFQFSSAFGLASLAASLAIAVAAFSSEPTTMLVRLVAAVALVFTPSLVGIAGSGLETSFAGLLIVLMGLLVSRDSVPLAWFATLSVALLSTRPDGALFVAAGAFAVVVPGSLRELRAWRPLLKKTLRFGAVSAGLLIAFQAFRYVYFGDLFPNTYYAKNADVSSWESGFAYVSTFVRSAPHVVALIALWFVGAFVLRRRLLRRDIYGLVSLFAYVVYVMKVGGDFMSYRFAFQVLPLIFLLWAGAIEMPGAGLMGLVAAVIGSTLPEVPEVKFGMQTVHLMNSFVSPGRRVGLALRAAVPETTRISTTLAGTVPYYSQLFTIDEWGLNDREIAHAPSRPIPPAGRGHMKKVSAEYLDRRQVNLELSHPTICDCVTRCDESRPNVYLRLDGGRDCVRMRYRTPTPELTKLFCSDRRFQIVNIDCHPEPLPAFSFAIAPGMEVPSIDGLQSVVLTAEQLVASAHGTSFGKSARKAALVGQSVISGVSGTFVNGFHGGDFATGWIDLALPANTKRVDLVLAGGRESDTLFVGIVDGNRVLARRGGDETEAMKPVSFGVPPDAVQPRLVVFDGSSAGWGHLLVGGVSAWVPAP